jgi:hypothetical protein
VYPVDINILVDIFDYCQLAPRRGLVGKRDVPEHLQYLDEGFVRQRPLQMMPWRYRALRIMNDYMQPDAIWRHIRKLLLTHLDDLCYWPGYVKPELYPNQCVDPKCVIADRKNYFVHMITAGRGDVFDILKICELVCALKAQAAPDDVCYEITSFPYWRWVESVNGEYRVVAWRPEHPACNIDKMRDTLIREILDRPDPTEIGVGEVARMTGYSVERIRRECKRALGGETVGQAALKPLSGTGRQYRFNRFKAMEWMWRNGAHTWQISD